MRHYSNWIKAYVQHTRYSESPDAYHFWTAVATVAGALRRRVWIDQRNFQWTPNFYIILVGPPGVAAKSTSIRSGLGLLERIPGINIGPQSATWQALGESLQNAQEGVEIPGIDETQLMSCLTIGISELGTFLRPDNKELVDFLVAVWDGQKEIWRRKTKTQGDIVVHNPWLNIIACTTPAWLKDNFPDVLIGGGLTSRMVFVFADRKRQLVAYPAKLINAADYKDEEERLFEDLTHISTISGEYELSPEAIEWGEQWYAMHWTSARTSHLASERYAGYFARKQTHIHKLAIVLAAAQRDELVILPEDLQAANTLITDLEEDMQHVFSAIGVSQGAQISSELLTLVKASRKITLKELWRLSMNTTAQKDFTEALKGLVEAGYIKVFPTAEGKVLQYSGPKIISPSLPSDQSQNPDTDPAPSVEAE